MPRAIFFASVLRKMLPLAALAWMFSLAPAADKYVLDTFDRQRLSDEYYSEGAHAADLNRDGIPDVVYGPYWFEGPSYEKKYEIYPPKPQDREAYADHFFVWIHDFDDDGWNDVFTVGFPGTPAFVYQNPGAAGFDKHWRKHPVFDWVSNESPQLTQLVGDPRPELVCTRDGFFGFATVNWEKPFEPWVFHPVSEQITDKRFGHGLGIGDVNNDGRLDIVHAKGWFEQPEADALTARWIPHDAAFSTAYGGAEMYVYDVDGDGDNDVITSNAAHDFGLFWYEQKVADNGSTFQPHRIMGSHPSENRYGLVFSELHSVNLADIDGDGLKDIVTGKTYYSHHKGSPMWDAGAVVYWFKLVRGKEGVDWIPYQADGESGIGRQLSLVDLQSDRLLDVVVGGMKGAHVLRHRRAEVDKATWEQAQPKLYTGPAKISATGAAALRGRRIPLDAKTGRVAGAVEGESLKAKISAGSAAPQPMGGFDADRWSGDAQLWWTGAQPGDTLEVEFASKAGLFDLDIVLTCARDYGIVQLSLDGKPLGKPIDLYDPQVITTGVLSFPKLEWKEGKHKLGVQIVGANDKAAKAYMAGIDYLRLRDPNDKLPEPDEGVKPTAYDGRVLNLDFESGTLDDWKVDGEAFVGQPIRDDTVAKRRPDMRSGHRGNFWIGGYEKTGDKATGTLTSVPFPVTHDYASFLMNGGEHANTRVELVLKETGNVFYKVSGENNEELRQVVVDLRKLQGKEIFVRIADDNRGPWGHINFDHFRFHENRPAPLKSGAAALVVDEYPHSGLNAEEAAKAMKLPQGFRVTVGAAEPDVMQPIAMALDDRGRVWIAEAYEYPRRAEGAGRDRILIFEDRDGDGRFDDRKVFIEGLNLVSGLEVGFGGVWVGAAPELLFIPDRDGDDRPDGAPEVLLDGWGYQDTHETLNAFIWGPDGWLYGCHGVFTHSRVGKPGTPEEQRIPLNAAIWRYHPTRHQFDVFAHGTSNPWGVDFNDHGQAFCTACVIPHLFHIVQGARYQRQAGEHFNKHTYRDIQTIADHVHYLGATPHSGNNKSDEAGGGHAHAGAMIYLGGAWPDHYRNQIFMNNIHGQRLNVDVPRPSGSGYIGGHGPDFLLTGDRASQILNLRYGPDGQAWMIDWYDMQACHTGDVKAHDRSNGRIYKIQYGDQRSPPVDLRAATDLELANHTLHKNDWFVRHARRLLQERAQMRPIAGDALGRLREIAVSHADDTRRLRAAWALHGVGGIDSALHQKLTVDSSPYLRGWSIQLAMEPGAALREQMLDERGLDKLAEMARSDRSPVVRLYLASALQSIPAVSRWTILAALAQHAEDASDHNLPCMLWYAAEPLADLDPERALALALASGSTMPLLREHMLRRIGSSDLAESLPSLLRALGKSTDADLQLTFLQAIRAALRGQRRVSPPEEWQALGGRLAQSPSNAVRLQAIALGVTFGDPAATAAARGIVNSTKSPTAMRQEALQALLSAQDPELGSVLVALLDDPALREAALRGLAQYDDPRTAELLVNAYGKLAPAEKRAALTTLCSRTSHALTLLAAVEAKKIPGTDLTADLIRQMQFLKHEPLQQRLQAIWGTARESAEDKLKLIEHYRQVVAQSESADPWLGRAVFSRTCQRCHILYGIGNKVGPDLTGSNRVNLDYLLSNIVDPSAVMAKEYQQTIVVTDGGLVVSGIVRGEDARSLTLQTADATVIVPIGEIESRTLSDKSMMPEDQLKQFSDHEVRSLIAYLSGKEQTPILATQELAELIFNGRDLTGWSGQSALWSVENGEIVGRTSGLARNEFLVSDMAAADFRLTLEVKLVANEGNSGIQFRSQALPGDVKGYQADVGPGWWGKLYEEHGRALLWEKSGEAAVKSGDWNRYEIEAIGTQIRTKINGRLCVDLDDPRGANRGIFALQLHSGGPTEVRFRNLKLEVIDGESTPAAGR